MLARDVCLVVLAPSVDSSMGSQLPAVVDAIAGDARPAQVMARVTRRTVEKLALAPGRAVWSHVKTVALTT